MDRYNWSELPFEQLNPLVSRQAIHTAGMTIARLLLKKGAVVPLHQHPNEQVTMLKSGSLLFEMGGQEIVVNAGDVLHIPPGLPHRVVALEDSMATDLFTPPRQDWIDGDDAYLRK